MSDLNVRAAKAMEWTLKTVTDPCIGRTFDNYVDSNGVGVGEPHEFDFEEDRNAAHELLMEVGRRGLWVQFTASMSTKF